MVPDILLAIFSDLVYWMPLRLLIELVTGKQFLTQLNVQLILILVEGRCVPFGSASKNNKC